jgi:diguanylate cyclase (GGDEF)-like protein/PAS domain S-box-containing protein
VPDRVRMAFDTLTEGVMIVDAQGRIVLTNSSFRTLGGGSGDDLIGRKPEDVAWLTQALEDDEDSVPWLSAMQVRQPVRGRPLNIEQPGRVARRAILNCAPVLDATGVARGCMVTFNDVTQLEQAHEQLLDALAELASSKQQLEVRNDELQNLASRDPLSGCLNRRAFFGGLEVMFRDARQKGRNLACIICDGDWFKSINDNYGHAVGDLVIAAIGRILSDSVRHSDLVCRYGGEEFCVAMPGMSDQGAVMLAERLRARIEAECAASIPALQGAKMTASFGVSSMTSRPQSGLQLVDQADRALYAAKRAGRNRVAAYSDLDESEAMHGAQAPAH